MPLGLPSSVKYINVANRPKRFFRKRDDGTLEEYYPEQAGPQDSEREAPPESSMRWHSDA